MCETLYEIHVWGYRFGSPDFYVKDLRDGKRYPDYEWPEEFKNLDAEFINEHSKFIVDFGYGPDYVKCYFVDRDCILGNLCIHGELTEAGRAKEFLKQQERHQTTGEFYPVPIYHRPEKK